MLKGYPLARSNLKTLTLTSLGMLLTTTAPVSFAQSEKKTNDEVSGKLENITVTARRVEESLQNTPIAVSALSAETLDVRGVQFASDVGKYVPNVQFDSTASESGGGASSQISIRGIGQTDYVITVEPGVGVYLDGVYVGKSMGSLLDTVDVDQIEVLRGPQGTLFGKNTLGGAIQVTSKRPTEHFEGSAQVTLGSYGRSDFKGFVSGALSDDVRARLSLSNLSRDGHVDRVSVLPTPQTGERTGETQGNVARLSGRLAVEWDITENLMATFTGDMTKVRENTPGQVLLGANENSDLNGAYHGGLPTGECLVSAGDARFSNPLCYNQQYTFGLDELKTTASGPNQSDADISGLSLKLDWQFEDFDITSITARRAVKVDVAQDFTLSPYNYGVIEQDIDWEQFTQEIQITGELLDGRLSYVGGVFYGNEEGTQIFPVKFRDFGFISGGKIDSDSFAVFGQANYDLTEQLSLTLGLRYTDETRRFNPGLQQFTNYSDPNAAEIPGYYNVFEDFNLFGDVGAPLFPEGWYERDSNDVTPLATLSYQVNNDIMVYGSYSEGYKGGGFVMRYFPAVEVPAGLTADDIIGYADPETAVSMEVGIKAELFDKSLRVNASLFQVDYDDIQVTYNVTVDSVPVPTLANAGNADIKGLELEIVAVPANWLQIQSSFGYIDASYTGFNADALAAYPGANSFDFANTPEMTFHLGSTVTFFDDTTGRLFLRGDYSWKDQQYKDFSNSPTLLQDSYGIVDMSLNYANPDNTWQVSLGGTNLTDEIYIVSGVSDADRTFAVVSRPREWSLRFKYYFDGL